MAQLTANHPPVFPLHEQLPAAMILAGVGGFMDAYSYLLHGNVFSSLQSGNVILLGIHLARGQWASSGHYLLPLAAFYLGAFLITWFARYVHKPGQRRTHIVGVSAEIFVLLLTAIFANRLPDTVVIAMMSFTAAIQLSVFRKMKGQPYTTTMTTGNIQASAANLANAAMGAQPNAAHRSWDRFAVALGFGLGAFLSASLVPFLGQHAIIGGVLLLGIILLLLLREKPTD
ncbi:YoaK family protein [Schleiferilactobacillus perolens]|uniref:YoaK family protein n=1 Tax=Schleiferilactobacillus perolens TaxID=100468 RepID=UPI0023557F26|nr:YoaK family protein [Schleiferilactobacillus perolens]MCI1891556.1 DUF1275 domain-containing protein [Schleiferilactobacillus harbinensis]MCI1913663.1 DUF1275 domain-containing protein [Schleiferilactobacillus harbinensis]MCI2172036.1 DUF1275 domain-containing protein [Schleiferilactobacillus perolens]